MYKIVVRILYLIGKIPLSLEKVFHNMAGHNNLSIRELLFEKAASEGGFTIPYISSLTGFSSTSIYRYVEEMKAEGLLREISSEVKEGRGRRPARYILKDNSRYFVGVDVKNFGLSMGLMNFAGEMEGKNTVSNFVYENSYANLDLVCQDVKDFITRDCNVSMESVAGVRFCLGGRVNSKEGVSATLYNFEDAQDTTLAQILSERLGIKASIENDTKAMTYGEYTTCFKDKWQDLLFVNIGWGLGLGIIINGQLYYGGKGFSGELGHMYAYNNNILCHCGKKGCIETEVSGKAIARKIEARIVSGESSVLSQKVHSQKSLTTEDILDAVEQEDPLAIETVSATGTELGKQLAGMMNIFNPECIVIGGIVAQVPSFYFIQPASLAIKQYSLRLISQNVPILQSSLKEDAGIIGAALMERNEYFFKERK